MKKNLTLMTDLYELTMAQTYFDEGKKDEIGYFDVFFRKNPFNTIKEIALSLKK